ncbi:hypothetical protein [Saccharibacillus endophyticus]|uniref:Uncharacterized protein n=1 Tax=Saccharibacillus endophyticus TaxID=2060666 RepID=A0ABQ2A1R9_9BACL|nr:hypothetical protein [Saccharibacillus endophyticus]GGH82576.1 hypothetical protein GCM10007362_34100 [Saccharibacillus endophyticus]
MPKEADAEKKVPVFTKFIAAVLPSTILLFLLFMIFPNTGLGRILTTPLTYIVNLGLIGFAFLISRAFTNKYASATFLVTVALTLVVTIWLYPQEYEPHIVVQMWNGIVGK